MIRRLLREALARPRRLSAPRRAVPARATAGRIQLNNRLNGVLQMADALAGRSGLHAIHLISHGSSGELLLGSTCINSFRRWLTRGGGLLAVMASADDDIDDELDDEPEDLKGLFGKQAQESGA